MRLFDCMCRENGTSNVKVAVAHRRAVMPPLPWAERSSVSPSESMPRIGCAATHCPDSTEQALRSPVANQTSTAFAVQIPRIRSLSEVSRCEATALDMLVAQ